MKIAIVHGEIPAHAAQDEQDTLIQAATVQEVLLRQGHTTRTIDLPLNLAKAADALLEFRPDVVFNLVETVGGQGRLLHLGPALFDALHLPYTGAKTDAIFTTSNKLLAKQLLRGARLPTPEWFRFQDLTDATCFSIDRYIVKSVWEHASVGMSEASVLAATSVADLRQALTQRLTALGGEGFAEAYIEGREFNLALLAGPHGPQVLPPAEIRFEAYPAGKLKIVDYRAKWDETSFEYQHTVRHFDYPPDDEPLLQRLSALALDCWRCFDLRGYARVDFRVDQANQPWVLEINANPCLSPDAGFMAAAAQAGLTADHVIERILHDTI